MLRYALAALLAASSPAISADGFSTVPEYQPDFDSASRCEPLNGRKVWKGKEAYYLQAWLLYTGESGALDEEVANPVPLATNEKDTLDMFEALCK